MKGYMGQQYPYSTILEENIVVIIYINGIKSNFSTKPQNLSNGKYKIAYLDQYWTRKKYLRLYGKTLYVTNNTEENFKIILHIYWGKDLFTIFYHQYTESK